MDQMAMSGMRDDSPYSALVHEEIKTQPNFQPRPTRPLPMLPQNPQNHQHSHAQASDDFKRPLPNPPGHELPVRTKVVALEYPMHQISSRPLPRPPGYDQEISHPTGGDGDGFDTARQVLSFDRYSDSSYGHHEEISDLEEIISTNMSEGELQNNRSRTLRNSYSSANLSILSTSPEKARAAPRKSTPENQDDFEEWSVSLDRRKTWGEEENPVAQEAKDKSDDEISSSETVHQRSTAASNSMSDSLDPRADDYHRPLAATPTVPAPATPVSQSSPRLAEGLGNMNTAGCGLQELSAITERVEEAIAEIEKYSAAPGLNLFKKPAYIESLISLVDTIEKFARALAIGDAEARALFRGIEARRTLATYSGLISKVMDLAWSIEGIASLKGFKAQSQATKQRKNMLVTLERLHASILKLVRAMESYAGWEKLKNDTRVGKCEHLITRISRVYDVWRDKVEPSLGDQARRLIVPMVKPSAHRESME